MSAHDHCALSRANRVSRTDEKRIRSGNPVMEKSKNGLALLWPQLRPANNEL